jgi:hypothetical protein
VPREESVPTCYNCDLQDGESPHPASYRSCTHAKWELERRRNLWTTSGLSREDILLETQHQIDQSPLLLAVLISSIGSNYRNKNSNSFQDKYMHRDINQISGRSVQAKNVNTNAMDYVFLAFTMVQQIMIELSCAVTGKGKVAVITKAVFRLLKNSANNSS